MKNRAFLRFPFFKEKALTFSYDDGVIYDKKLIEIFNKHGLKGTFNICTDLFGKGRILAKEEAVNLYGNPCAEVAVHGHNHLSISNVDCAVATNDVLLNRKELEQTFGSIVKGMAYANGHYNDAVKSILKNCGINYARTVAQTNAFDLPEDWLEWHPTCHHDNQKLMELAENFVNYKRPSYFWSYRPKVFYVWVLLPDNVGCILLVSSLCHPHILCKSLLFFWTVTNSFEVPLQRSPMISNTVFFLILGLSQ